MCPTLRRHGQNSPRLHHVRLKNIKRGPHMVVAYMIVISIKKKIFMISHAMVYSRYLARVGEERIIKTYFKEIHAEYIM